MSMRAEQPAARRPGLLVYGVMLIVACCVPALLLMSVI
jgi:hypothetical protein